MIRRLLLAVLVAGAVAGLAASAVQALRVTPLIVAAEEFEGAGHSHGAKDGAEADHAHAPWEPSDGAERWAYTVLTNVLTGVGFGFFLGGAMVLAGRPLNARNGAVWGLAGFLAASALPAVGLPPELPGAAAAALAERQGWWLLTVAASALGLAALVFRRGGAWRLIGIGLLLLPHAIGAPHPLGGAGSAPPELAAQFVMASLLMAAAFWTVLGGVLGHMLKDDGARA